MPKFRVKVFGLIHDEEVEVEEASPLQMRKLAAIKVNDKIQDAMKKKNVHPSHMEVEEVDGS